MYDYLCVRCNVAFADPHFERLGVGHPTEDCPECGGRVLRAVVSVRVGPTMQEHFNAAVGKPISSHRQFVEELRKKSDAQSELTGTEARYVPVDLTDPASLGVTEEGLDRTRKLKRDSGADAPTRRIIV